jgi:integral membrane sensor domain MASE1/anti-sigma regulatory factor (Ser/Thr protein kinase)
VTVAVAYAIGAGCSWLLFNASSVAVFFPPAGVTLGALLLTARRHWPWALAAAGAVEFAVDAWQGLSPALAAGFVLANVAEPLAGATLVRGFRPGRLDLTRRGDAATFLGCAVIAGPLVGALIGSTTMALGMGRTWWPSFGQFWAGDALAVLTLGAAIVGAGVTGPGPLRRIRPRRVWRGAAVLAAAAGLTVVGFWPTQVPLAYLPVPLLLAVGFRGKVATVGAAGFVVAFAANLLTAAGRGPWAALADQPRLEAATLQIYIAFLVLSAWVLAIAVTERDQARADSRREFAARVRLQALQDVTAGLATAATPEQVVRVLVDGGVGVVADHGAVGLIDPTDDRLRLWPTRGAPRLGDTDGASAAWHDPVSDAAQDGAPVSLTGPDELAARYPRSAPALLAAGTRSVLAVPIRAGPRSLGALAFGFRLGGGLDGEVASVARTLAELAGQAIERARLYQAEHEAAHELQRALLPSIATDLPGVSAAVRYRPAERGRDVGGDWYDVFELPGNRVGITVGDVAGHGLRAAVAMGRLQQSLRSVALTGAVPAEVLESLDDACGSIPGAEFATVGYAEYTPTDAILTYASAAHPPPLLVTGGRAEYLRGGRSQPLGLPSGARTQAQVAVPPGAMLVWYSDGLLERRGEVIDVGLERLAAAARGLPGADPRAWCDGLLAELTDGRPSTDDVVVTCLRLGGTPVDGHGSAVLRLTVSETGDLAETRRALRDWAAVHGIGPEQTEDLLVACNEALSNALEHAYRGRPPGRAALKVVQVAGRRVRVEISDSGRWRVAAPDGATRGRGLPLINSLAQRVLLDVGSAGTRITITLAGP